MSKNDAINLLNNSALDNTGVLQWILVQIKHLFKYLMNVHLEELILETFILVLMVNGIESHGNNLMIILFHLKLDRFYSIGVMN